MTAAAELVQSLRRRGVILEPMGDRLRVRPASRVSPDELEALRRAKPAVLDLLRTEHALSVPPPDSETVREVLGPDPAPADLDTLHHELAGALWELRDRQAGRQPWGGPLLVRGRPLADWLPLEEVARILRSAPRECR
ncbi:MAG: hypothetical protein HYY95_00675 [Candidatus Rokubacteria bacterium]|nr:hypothetical protein [Candidatus Rokubacteria bacterium]